MIKRIFKKNTRKQNQAEQEAPILRPGDRAPGFKLPGTAGQILALSDYRGRPVVLAFYPADNSPVCRNQLALYNEALPLLEEYDAQLFGISTDDPASHDAFAADGKFRFPLLADHDPAGAVATRYGVYDESGKTCERALFVVDADGVIAWSHLSPKNINPGADGILKALEELERPEDHR